MNVEVINTNDYPVAVVSSNEQIIYDSQSAMDLMASMRYEHNVSGIALNKEAINEDFFKLSTGIAGEILQKFVNYDTRLAIFGDFSGYTSKPLKDFIYECNNGNHIYFVENREEAVKRLT